MPPKQKEKKRKKLGFKCDEFDDFKSANEDSDDVNYNPTAPNKKRLKKQVAKGGKETDQQKQVKEMMEDLNRQKMELEECKKEKKDKKKKKKKHKHKRRSEGSFSHSSSSADPEEEARKEKKRKKRKKKQEGDSRNHSQLSDDGPLPPPPMPQPEKEDVVDITEMGDEPMRPEIVVPKREMKVCDLAEIKFRKYKVHERFEQKQQALIQQGAIFNIMNESSNNFFGNVTPQLCGVKKREIKQQKVTPTKRWRKRWVLCPNAIKLLTTSNKRISINDIWVKKWVYSSVDQADQKYDVLLGNETGGGILTKDQVMQLRKLVQPESTAYEDNFYYYQQLEDLYNLCSSYQCVHCDRIFFDQHSLRNHMINQHPNEGLRTIAAGGPSAAASHVPPPSTYYNTMHPVR